ncbi:restriction endonuclease subunit S [Marinobacter salarius]|uniref:restriction endonuclease subunit S n=1 Tax=Marinobacter salarius TaxID=1420917 RepID=UPI0022B072F1|nr:restriction endonuclease subunit S [Marinobacter salarius]MCZ4283559.1 restriction endonuclease subunit S [Marinobacter salarius]
MSNRVPDDWTLSKVGELSQVKRGASPRPIQDPKWWGGSVGWVRISDVTRSHKYLTKTTQYLSDEGVSKSVRVATGEVILSICATIGRPIIVGVDACIHDGFVWFDKLRNSINREYWYYFLSSKENYLSGQRQSGTQGNLNTSIVAELECPLPPLPEQQKIAAILSSVDDVIEKTRAQIDKLKDLKSGMMQELLTKGVGSGGVPHTEFKDSPVGRIPACWEVHRADDISDAIMVGVVIKPTQYYVDQGVPALRSANVRENGLTMDNLKYFSEESNDRLHKSKLSKGDLLTVRTGYPGTTAVVTKEFEGCNCIDVVITRPSAEMDSDFLCLWVNSNHGKGQVLKAQGGLAQQHFNVGDMKNLLVPIPPLEEQRGIFRAVESVIGKLSISEIRLAQFSSLKKALMQDLLTGKVRVNVDQKESAVA